MASTALINFSSKTTNYTLVASDDVVQFNCSSGSLVATLPDATTVPTGRKYEIRRASDATGTNTLTINTTSGQTVDGRASGSIKLQPSDYAAVVSDGSNWQVIYLQETIAAHYFASANGTANSSSPFNFDTKVFDTHNAVTTGASWKFTAPSPGKYLVQGFLTDSAIPAGGGGFILYKNGSAFEAMNIFTTSVPWAAYGTEIQLNNGDTIEIRTSVASFPWSGGTLSSANACTISIAKTGN